MARPKKQRPVSVSIFHGTDGLWHGYLTVGTRPDGRPDRRHRRAKTYEECADKIRQLETQRDSGTLPRPGRPPTVEVWLRHWCENIARPTVSYSTYQNSYRYAVYRYLIPGLGAHRLDALEPEHLEALYAKLRRRGLSEATVALIHRTARTALAEAVRRDKLALNPASRVKLPKPTPFEVDPLSVDEARRLLAACATRRNGARWSVAMLGLRQGEALGLHWADLDFDTGILTVRGQAQRRTWQHGCKDPVACAVRRCRRKPCRPAWAHGCPDPATCRASQGRACRKRKPAHCPDHRGDCPPPCADGCVRHAAFCPDRHGGGIVLDDRTDRRGANRRRVRTKSEAGTRRLGVPTEVLAELRAHRRRQREERLLAGSLWRDHGLIFCSETGRPVDAGTDRAQWKALLVEAGVRDVRGHDARHFAATALLLKGVDRRVVMDVMGWSSERMLTRYQHVVDEMRTEAARRLGDTLYAEPPATPIRRRNAR